MTKNIRVLIVDDHTLMREGLRTLINSEPRMEVIGEAADGIEAVEKARLLNPDVILMDLVMPRGNGVEAIGEIRRENPKAVILVLSSFGEDDKVFPAIKAGARGYLLKDASPIELLTAIREVHSGRPSLHPSVAEKLMGELSRPHDVTTIEKILTEREEQVLRLVAKGYTNQEIAEKLNITERTAGTHISNILDKLHLANRTQAALYALREGLTSLYQD